MPLWCLYPFLPREFQPHLRCTKFGASNNRRNATSTTTPFSRRQSFRYVQAPMLASPPDGTYRAGSKSYGQPGRLHHAMDWKLPPRTVVSLHDRIGQLSWRDFHPLDCSLVGRYLQRWGLLSVIKCYLENTARSQAIQSTLNQRSDNHAPIAFWERSQIRNTGHLSHPCPGTSG